MHTAAAQAPAALTVVPETPSRRLPPAAQLPEHHPLRSVPATRSVSRRGSAASAPRSACAKLTSPPPPPPPRSGATAATAADAAVLLGRLCDRSSAVSDAKAASRSAAAPSSGAQNRVDRAQRDANMPPPALAEPPLPPTPLPLSPPPPPPLSPPPPLASPLSPPAGPVAVRAKPPPQLPPPRRASSACSCASRIVVKWEMSRYTSRVRGPLRSSVCGGGGETSRGSE
eukprot:366222-Chlamydomonas_euryale.AAC.3